MIHHTYKGRPVTDVSVLAYYCREVLETTRQRIASALFLFDGFGAAVIALIALIANNAPAHDPPRRVPCCSGIYGGAEAAETTRSYKRRPETFLIVVGISETTMTAANSERAFFWFRSSGRCCSLNNAPARARRVLPASNNIWARAGATYWGIDAETICLYP